MATPAHYIDLKHIFKSDENETHRIVTFTFQHHWDTIYNPEFEGQREGDIIIALQSKKEGETIMSDSWMERDTNEYFVVNAKGDVLIAGLGLGMIVLAIQGKKEVKSITIVEKDESLASLVLSQLQQHLTTKVSIIYSDIFKHNTDKKFDTMYFDIWNNVGMDGDYRQMLDLKKRFKKNRKKGCNVSCWREKDCKDITRAKNKKDY